MFGYVWSERFETLERRVASTGILKVPVEGFCLANGSAIFRLQGETTGLEWLSGWLASLRYGSKRLKILQ